MNSTSRHARLGLVYLVVVGLLMTMCVMAYRKDLPWQRTVDVTLVTTRPGLELNPQSDVKIQGRVVGVVRQIDSNGRTATIHLALGRDEVRWVPRNVDAAIVPKTLFGEKFVDLLPPPRATTARIAGGDRIRQSRTAVELGTVYAKLVPLLRAVDPAQLSTVLNTLAASLNGKGEQIGRTITQANEFLGRLDPELPVLATDLRQLARTLAVYDDAAPHLLKTLSNATRISNDLLVPREARLQKLLGTVVGTADTTRKVLADNEEAIVAITGRARPLVAVLDRYATNIPCSLSGLHVVDRLGNQNTGSRGPYVNLSIDMFVNRKAYRYPQDLPSNPGSQANLYQLPKPLVPSWDPHCPRFGPQMIVPDAQPNSLAPLGGQAIAPGDQKKSAAVPRNRPAPSYGRPAGASTSALSQAIAGQLLGDRHASWSGFGGLLVQPMLSDGQVRIP